MTLRRVLLILAISLAGAGSGLIVQRWRQNYRVYVVHTGSMSPSYRPGDLVIDKATSGPYQVGQVITFPVGSGPDSVVTHRIASVSDDGIHTKGDANRTADFWNISPKSVVGTVTGHVRYAGFAAVYLSQLPGVASLLTAVLAMALAWRLFFPAEA